MAKVWLNGKEVHKFIGNRELAFGQDTVPVELSAGRNAIIIKVVNVDGPGGIALGIRAAGELTLCVE